MANEVSFDISSTVDLQEVDNAVQQVMKEIQQRFDFKGSACRVARDDQGLLLYADDAYKLKAVAELLESKLVRRKVSLKALVYEAPESAAKGTIRQRATLQQGISADKAKEITKAIRALGLKVVAQIQSDQIRVSAKSKDDLQAVIQALRAGDFGIDLQFGNYR
ncbi:MAG: YajQ family cyclic di-GMP-binding protein [candidate division NC10 bacterium]|nr:YajQ family cyclic di-GMP-binding protein [candidate division NC10 bacterium]MDE2321586.1 YajQ family cyclic di-GMP-binding protein [candidate division NC10 bacterium]